MMVYMRKLLSFLGLLLLFGSGVLASTPDTFFVGVSPNPSQPNEPVDLTIKALQADGTTVVTDYLGTVIMDFETYIDPNTYDMPNNGLYEFTAQDLWVKTFSKWLVIKKAGTYTLKVVTSSDDSVVWSVVLMVGSGSSGTSSSERLLQILSPSLSGELIESSAINIIGKADANKTPLQFFVDDKKIEFEAETDETGNFSVYLTDIEEWNHTIVVKMVDYQGNILWESEEILVDYKEPETDQFLKSFTVTPNGKVNLWDTVIVEAEVDGTVRSVELRIGDMGLYPMERKTEWEFTKTVTITEPGVQTVDATLIFEWGQRTIYADRETLDVTVVDGVSTIKIINDIADPQKVSLSRQSVGSPSSYLIRYGQSKDNLSSEIKSNTTNVSIPQLEIGKEYFFQIYTVDSANVVSSKGSDIASVLIKGQWVAWEWGVLWWWSSSCTVVGIKVRTEKIGDEYFLVWDSVPWAVWYTVYRSEFVVNSIDQMQKVGDTSIAQFAYPFDATAEQDQYAYYAVTAACNDGTSLQVDNIKKIHVWPLSDFITIVMVCLLCYSLYRLYKFS